MEQALQYIGIAAVIIAFLALVVGVVKHFSPKAAAEITAVEKKVEAIAPALALKIAAEAKAAAEEAVVRVEAEAAAAAKVATEARAALTAFKAASGA